MMTRRHLGTLWISRNIVVFEEPTTISLQVWVVS